MSDISTREHDAAGLAHEPRHTTVDYEKSAKLAHDRITQCRRFLTFAFTIWEGGEYVLRSAGQRPSDDDKDDVLALKRQWQDLLDNKLLEGAGEVLHVAFLKGAEVELDKLIQSDAAAQTREAWKEVVCLVKECKTIKEEVEQVMVKTQALMPATSRNTFPGS
jgi:hypothetical protein